MIIERACCEIPAFGATYQQLLTNIRLNDRSESTLQNYGCCLAKLALYFRCCPTTLPDEQINEHLLLLRDIQTPSYSYFKHTVYGLRLTFRLIGREDRAIRLPSIQRIKSLPIVFSRAEIKQLIATPKWKKHRILFALIYSASLRISEASRLEQDDIDFDRMMIHIRQSKYKKDRYVPLSGYMKKGLQDYYEQSCPIK